MVGIAIDETCFADTGLSEQQQLDSVGRGFAVGLGRDGHDYNRSV